MTDLANKPRLKLINGQPMPATKLGMAELKFGRPFAHRSGTNFLRQAEHVLNRWARRADYYNLSPNLIRPASCTLHFKESK